MQKIAQNYFADPHKFAFFLSSLELFKTAQPWGIFYNGRLIDFKWPRQSVMSNIRFEKKNQDINYFVTICDIIDLMASGCGGYSHLVTDRMVGKEIYSKNEGKLYEVSDMVWRINNSAQLILPPSDEFSLIKLEASDCCERVFCELIEEEYSYIWSAPEVYIEFTRRSSIVKMLSTYDDHRIGWRLFDRDFRTHIARS